MFFAPTSGACHLVHGSPVDKPWEIPFTNILVLLLGFGNGTGAPALSYALVTCPAGRLFMIQLFLFTVLGRAPFYVHWFLSSALPGLLGWSPLLWVCPVSALLAGFRSGGLFSGFSASGAALLLQGSFGSGCCARWTQRWGASWPVVDSYATYPTGSTWKTFTTEASISSTRAFGHCLPSGCYRRTELAGRRRGLCHA